MSNNKFKVLIVEDEANICSFIETLLTTNDYQALVAHTCTMGLTLFASHNPDLVILDLGLPDRDGLEFIRTVRQKYMTPIVVLSARTDEMDKIEALDLGANDYITKPFAIEELLARIRAALRKRPARPEGETLTAGPLVMDTDRHEVTVKGKNVELTRREFDLLRYLLENKERVISRESLLDNVWGFDFVGETNAVDVYIRFLRSKIDEAFGIKLIHTVRGVGYVIREEGE